MSSRFRILLKSIPLHRNRHQQVLRPSRTLGFRITTALPMSPGPGSRGRLSQIHSCWWNSDPVRSRRFWQMGPANGEFVPLKICAMEIIALALGQKIWQGTYPRGHLWNLPSIPRHLSLVDWPQPRTMTRGFLMWTALPKIISPYSLGPRKWGPVSG